MPEYELKPPTLEAPLLDPTRLTDEAITRIAKQIYDAQTAQMTADEKAQQFLLLRPAEAWEEKIRKGELYYVGNDEEVEFCCFREHVGTVALSELPTDELQPEWVKKLIDQDIASMPVYKSGGLIVKDAGLIHKYSGTFKAGDRPDGIVITRTHGGIGRLMQRSGYTRIPQEEFNTNFHALADLYYQGKEPDVRPGANFYIRPPRIPNSTENQ